MNIVQKYTEMPVTARMNYLPDYPFSRLRALLNGCEPAPGLSVIDLSLGEPQAPPPAAIQQFFQPEHLASWGKYPAMDGTAALRAAIHGWLDRRYKLPTGFIDPDRMIAPVSGTREALYMLASLTISPPAPGADAPIVLLPNPCYAVYEGAALMAGAELCYLPTSIRTQFLPDLAAIPADVLPRAALMYLNSPSNPQGAVASADYLKTAIEYAQEHNFVLVVDECYAEIYLGNPPPGALEVIAQHNLPLKNVLVCHSLSKRSNAAGMRSGFVAGDPELVGAFKRLRSYAGAGMPGPIMAASAWLWSDDRHVETIRNEYRERFNVAFEWLGHPFSWTPPAGGFFAWLPVDNSEEAAKTLWEKAAIRALPGAYLGRPDPRGHNPGHGYLRLALTHPVHLIAEAVQRIADVLEPTA